MIKIKVNENGKYASEKVKCRNYSALEAVAILDTAISILKDDFKLSPEEVKDMIRTYKKFWKVV